ncbi:MAG: hypothetical protein ACF8R7_06890 [Phycisphaerales bacterium JB039]
MAEPSEGRRGLRARRWIIGLSALFVALVTCIVAVAATLADQAPVWWRSVRIDDPRTTAIGVALENRTSNALYEVRPADSDAGARYQSEVWTVEVTAREANAWLNARLPGWLASQWNQSVWPGEMSEIQVEFRDDEIALGARVNVAGRFRYFTATIDAEIGPDGALWVPARWISVGRLAAPGPWIIEHADRRRDQFIPDDFRDLPETAAMFRAFAGEAPIVQDAVVTLGDGRVVRLLSMRAEGGRLRITCRTERE